MPEIIEGFAAELSLVREASFNGSASGTPLTLRGKTAFSYQPILARGNQRVNVWRLPQGDSFTMRHYEGSLSATYSHDSAILIFLESLLGLFSTQADTPSVGFTTYSLRPARLENRKSIKIGLAPVPGTPGDTLNSIFTGAMIESLQLVLRSRELVKWKVTFKAAGFSQGSKLSPTINDALPIRSIDSSITLDDVILLTNAFEFTLNLGAKVQPAQFSRAGVAGKMIQDGVFSGSGEVVEFFSNDTLPAKARNLTEGQIKLELKVPGSVRRFVANWPRVVFRSGNPEGISPGDLVCRASFEGMHDDSLNTLSEPKISVVL